MIKQPVNSPSANNDFNQFQLSNPDLTATLDWVTDNFAPEDVYDFSDYDKWDIESVFSEDQLNDWAENAGLVNESGYVEKKDVKKLLKAIEAVDGLLTEEGNTDYTAQLKNLYELIADMKIQVNL